MSNDSESSLCMARNDKAPGQEVCPSHFMRTVLPVPDHAGVMPLVVLLLGGHMRGQHQAWTARKSPLQN